MSWEGDNTLCWYYHSEYTSDLDPSDVGTAKSDQVMVRSLPLRVASRLWQCGDMVFGPIT